MESFVICIYTLLSTHLKASSTWGQRKLYCQTCIELQYEHYSMSFSLFIPIMDIPIFQFKKYKSQLNITLKCYPLATEYGFCVAVLFNFALCLSISCN